MSSQDSLILDAVRGLVVQLNIPDPGLDEVSWRNMVGTGRNPRVMPSDHCEFWSHKLILPARMQDSLTVDEWRPIIASELAYRRLYSKVARRRSPVLLGPLVVIIVLAVVLIYVTGST